MDLPDWPAETENDAEQRYQHTRAFDPFPTIPPALLNSADVWDYVRATGMIYPFDSGRLKASSYEVGIGERCIFWDKNGGNYDRYLIKGEKFSLMPNSIVFVTTRECFRLPHYIAARFNLRIKNVHRGLLLGTGPLVDPGFSGPLLVPLHNLTTNEYEFSEGEDFAWFEFTKVSPHTWSPRHTRDGRLRGKYNPFPQLKTPADPRRYLAKACPAGPIRSSIPAAIAELEQSAKGARNEAERAGKDAENASKAADNSRDAAERARNRIYSIGWVAVAGLIISVGTLLYSSWHLLTSVHQSIADIQGQYHEIRTGISSRESMSDLHLLQERLNRLEGNLANARSQVEDLVEQLGAEGRLPDESDPP